MFDVERCFQPAREGQVVLILALLNVSLMACSPVSGPERTGDVLDRVRSVDLSPRFPVRKQPADSGAGEGTRTATYFGADPQQEPPADFRADESTRPSTLLNSDREPVGAIPAVGGHSYELSFENAPVAAVAKVVLGDIIGAGYTIDPR